MGVDLTISGDRFLSSYPYSVTEDSTPIDPSDTTGGVSQFSISVDEWADIRDSDGDIVTLADGAQGTTTGTVNGMSSVDGVATITADSRLNVIAVERTAQPYSGTLGGAFTYYLSLVGITTGIVIDSSITSIAVSLPGWIGNAWDEIKNLCTAQQVEVSLVSNNIVMRPLRGRLAQNYRDSSKSWAVSAANLARSIEIYYYSNKQQTNGLAYPSGGWTTDTPTQNAIPAGTTQTFVLPTTASLNSIQQPVCVDFVDKFYSASSVYTVIGGDSLPITAAEWIAEGGRVTAQLGHLDDDGITVIPDPNSIVITVVASPNVQNGPYTIAMSAGNSSDYSSLRLVGTGVFTTRQLITLTSGVDTSRVTTAIGVTVDNPMISTSQQAFAAGLWTLKHYGIPTSTITVTTKGINRIGDTGSYAYPTVAQFNAAQVGQLVSNFNTAWSGKTIADFNAYWMSTVQSTFANQAFGNIGGARLRYADAMFRIRSVTIAPESVQYSAEDDTTVADFDTIWTGKTIANFNTQWAGKTLANFALAPLQKDS